MEEWIETLLNAHVIQQLWYCQLPNIHILQREWQQRKGRWQEHGQGALAQRIELGRATCHLTGSISFI